MHMGRRTSGPPLILQWSMSARAAMPKWRCCMIAWLRPTEALGKATVLHFVWRMPTQLAFKWYALQLDMQQPDVERLRLNRVL